MRPQSPLRSSEGREIDSECGQLDISMKSNPICPISTRNGHFTGILSIVNKIWRTLHLPRQSLTAHWARIVNFRKKLGWPKVWKLWVSNGPPFSYQFTPCCNSAQREVLGQVKVQYRQCQCRCLLQNLKELKLSYDERNIQFTFAKMASYRQPYNELVAQWLERLLCIEKVGSSTPASARRDILMKAKPCPIKKKSFWSFYGHLICADPSSLDEALASTETG